MWRESFVGEREGGRKWQVMGNTVQERGTGVPSASIRRSAGVINLFTDGKAFRDVSGKDGINCGRSPRVPSFRQALLAGYFLSGARTYPTRYRITEEAAGWDVKGYPRPLPTRGPAFLFRAGSPRCRGAELRVGR